MIRRWKPADAETSYAVYRDAVRLGGEKHYTHAQLKVWVPSDTMEDWWAPRLCADKAWVTEDDAGLTGLIALRDDGYLDLFFVLPRARGSGAATALYDALFVEAQKDGLTRLTSHASLYLKPFLERRGWITLSEEQVERAGETLTRFEMAYERL